MKTLKIYGASDDLIEMEGISGANEFNATGSANDGEVMGTFIISGKVKIKAIYDGCWYFAIGQVDEAIPFPDWPVRITQSPEKDYSVLVEIDCPDDAHVVQSRQ